MLLHPAREDLLQAYFAAALAATAAAADAARADVVGVGAGMVEGGVKRSGLTAVLGISWPGLRLLQY